MSGRVSIQPSSSGLTSSPRRAALSGSEESTAPTITHWRRRRRRRAAHPPPARDHRRSPRGCYEPLRLRSGGALVRVENEHARPRHRERPARASPVSPALALRTGPGSAPSVPAIGLGRDLPHQRRRATDPHRGSVVDGGDDSLVERGDACRGAGGQAVRPSSRLWLSPAPSAAMSRSGAIRASVSSAAASVAGGRNDARATSGPNEMRGLGRDRAEQGQTLEGRTQHRSPARRNNDRSRTRRPDRLLAACATVNAGSGSSRKFGMVTPSFTSSTRPTRRVPDRALPAAPITPPARRARPARFRCWAGTRCPRCGVRTRPGRA